MSSDSDRFTVYADDTATTFITKRVLRRMNEVYCSSSGNPSSLYQQGRQAHRQLETSRKEIAGCINCDADELFFTSGGSESDCFAVKGAARYAKQNGKGSHIVASAVEHHAVLQTLNELENEGFDVSYVGVSCNGTVDPSELERSIRDDTLLVCVMYVNNELGTIQPVERLAAVSHSHGALFFTDAVQAVGKLNVDVKALGVDMLSFSAHKFHGPTGVGGLYLKNGVKLLPLINGGGQERGMRGGTENVPGICGMAQALTDEIVKRSDPKYSTSILKKRLYLERKLLSIDGTRLNSTVPACISEILNVSFSKVEGESLVIALDMKGVSVSSGSACASSSLLPSHVLLAAGVPEEYIRGTIRITVSDTLTYSMLDYIYKKIKESTTLLRNMKRTEDGDE
ncbi:MAG TPA: cysteine desulfurase family protein [Bacillota bacterium]|nr:cysteine desulfurase family protein [Bacillota bacterium]